MRKLNKKASIVDLFFIAIVLAFFSVAVLIGVKVATQFQENIASSDVFDDAPDAATYTNQAINNYTYAINSGFLFLTIFFIIATLALAALVRIHPIFIPLFLIALIFLIFFCGVMSNIYSGVAEEGVMTTTVSRFAIMHNIMIALPFIVGIIGIILMVIMYKNYQIG